MTPAERSLDEVSVEVDDDLADLAAEIEDWAEGEGSWSFVLREGHESGKHNNVVAELIHTSGDATSTLVFRLDQLERLTQLGPELGLILEERDGIAKAARLQPTGLAMEMFHILTFT